MKNLGYTQELFVRELKIGHKWSEYVASILNSAGIKCEATPMKIAKTEEERLSFATEKDVVFLDMPGHIEVKSRRLHFNEEPNSYPKDTAFVDTEFGWNLKDPLPLAVVLVSQETGSLLVIPVSSSPTWTTTRRFDNVRKITDTFLLVDKSHLKPWTQFTEWLNVRQEKYKQKESTKASTTGEI
jgi:hypothetical protein